jgi:hypothetical protein
LLVQSVCSDEVLLVVLMAMDSGLFRWNPRYWSLPMLRASPFKQHPTIGQDPDHLATHPTLIFSLVGIVYLLLSVAGIVPTGQKTPVKGNLTIGEIVHGILGLRSVRLLWAVVCIQRRTEPFLMCGRNGLMFTIHSDSLHVSR